MNIEEVKLKTMANLPSDVMGIMIYPLSIKEIIQNGYDLYNQALNLIAIKKEQLIDKEYLKDIPNEASVADFIYSSQDALLIEYYSNSLKLFLKTDLVEYDYRDGLYIDKKSIDSEMLDEIVKVVKIQNCLVTQEDDKFNPLNERAQKIREKMLENKRKIQELNSNSVEEPLSFCDLISIVCGNANGINILNVFDLNMYQFNDQFNRMKMIDDYEVNIQALLHGADSKEIELKHWMSKIK